MDPMKDLDDKALPLEDYAKSGILPMQLSKTGSEEEPLEEVIICNAMAGGARRINSMPEDVSLERRLANGEFHVAKYVQDVPVTQFPVVHYVHHGTEVAVRSNLKGKHREHCLCFTCDKFKDNVKLKSENDEVSIPRAVCMKATELYQFAKKYNVVTPVWECTDYAEHNL